MIVIISDKRPFVVFYTPQRLLKSSEENQTTTMSVELDLSAPEVPEPTFLESLLRYGLFLGAIFQLICILAVIIPTSKGHEQVDPHIRKRR